MCATFGRPSVNVPVLCGTRVSTFSMRSSASASRMGTPDCAPRPTPTRMMDIGVASPGAQGHAMMGTANPVMSSLRNVGDGPQTIHTPKVSAAIKMTTGMNQPATLSAMRWMDALLRWVAATI